MLPGRHLIIGSAAIVALVSFFLSWWTAPKQELGARYGFLEIFAFSFLVGGLMGAVLAWIAQRRGRQPFVRGWVFGAFITIGMVVPTVHDIIDLGLVDVSWSNLSMFLRYFLPFDDNIAHEKWLATFYLSIAAWLFALVYLLKVPHGHELDVVIPLPKRAGTETETASVEEFECEVCGTIVNANATVCPSCGVQFED